MFTQFFTSHPASVNESYLQHACVALSFALTLFVAAFAALAHALVPALFQTTASRLVAKLHNRLQARH